MVVVFEFLSTLPARGATCRLLDDLVDVDGFLSTLPARGATRIFKSSVRPFFISIHAPREGSDHSSSVRCLAIKLFLSTLPARGATDHEDDSAETLGFLSTLPARGATTLDTQSDIVALISIHAPREGSDKPTRPCVSSTANFYPRSPRGERRAGI